MESQVGNQSSEVGNQSSEVGNQSSEIMKSSGIDSPNLWWDQVGSTLRIFGPNLWGNFGAILGQYKSVLHYSPPGSELTLLRWSRKRTDTPNAEAFKHTGITTNRNRTIDMNLVNGEGSDGLGMELSLVLGDD